MDFIELSPKILAFRINGAVNENDVQECEKRARDLEREQGEVNLYMEIIEFADYEVRTFFNKLKASLKDNNEFENVALVCPQSWLEKYAEVLSGLGSVESETFDEGREEEAREWILAKSENK